MLRSLIRAARFPGALLLICILGCATPPDGITDPIPIDVPHLFYRVRKGEDLEHKRFLLSGVALTASQSGMVMVGDPIWLEREGKAEFVPVFGIPAPVSRGTPVQYRVRVTAAQMQGNAVVVEADCE